MTLGLLIPSVELFGQTEDTLKQQELTEVKIDRNFSSKYNRRLSQLRRTYPMALYAKKMIEQYEADLKAIEKRRKQKQYGKSAHKELKETFSFNIKDLYVDEGDLLLRLIHRETGMTVSEIIKKYRGPTQKGLYSSMAKLWGHNLSSTYDAEGEDWITEVVIQDILSGKVNFDLSLNKMHKTAYKESMKSYKANRKAYRKKNRKKASS